jgi:thiosulfate/3-mercaptopyruvate sulfurtransferase
MKNLSPLVQPDWLCDHLDDAGLRIIDVRWYLDHDTGEATSGRAAYEKGHIPNAAFVDLEAVSGTSGAGRHPLPEPERFQEEMRTAGVSRGSAVVVYDDQGGFSSARLWWLLRYFGHDSVSVLDGGLPAWRGPLRSGTEEVDAGDFVATPREWMKLDYEDLRSTAGNALLIDARRRGRYLGEFEPFDAKAGHIPGAVSAYWRDNLTADGRFKSAEELRRRYEALRVRQDGDVVAYCSSGVSACHDLLALEVAGLPGGRLYPGSWSDWSRRDAPVGTGEEPPSALGGNG